MEEEIMHCRDIACNQLASKCFGQAIMYVLA
jgi:hypothetical protein